MSTGRGSEKTGEGHRTEDSVAGRPPKGRQEEPRWAHGQHRNGVGTGRAAQLSPEWRGESRIDKSREAQGPELKRKAQKPEREIRI